MCCYARCYLQRLHKRLSLCSWAANAGALNAVDAVKTPRDRVATDLRAEVRRGEEGLAKRDAAASDASPFQYLTNGGGAMDAERADSDSSGIGDWDDDE